MKNLFKQMLVLFWAGAILTVHTSLAQQVNIQQFECETIDTPSIDGHGYLSGTYKGDSISLQMAGSESGSWHAVTPKSMIAEADSFHKGVSPIL